MNIISYILTALQAINAGAKANFNSAQTTQNKFKSSAGERIFK